MTMRETLIEALIPKGELYTLRRRDGFEIVGKSGAVIFKGGWNDANKELARLHAAARLDAVLAILSEPTTEMMRAACKTMRDGGLGFYHPDDGGLYDIERHSFETLRAAIVAAIREAGD